VPPVDSLNLGVDDVIRLTVFVVVAVITASISSARRQAQRALRHSLQDLQAINIALRKIGEWPQLVGVEALEGTREMLEHARKSSERMRCWPSGKRRGAVITSRIPPVHPPRSCSW